MARLNTTLALGAEFKVTSGEIPRRSLRISTTVCIRVAAVRRLFRWLEVISTVNRRFAQAKPFAGNLPISGSCRISAGWRATDCRMATREVGKRLLAASRAKNCRPGKISRFPPPIAGNCWFAENFRHRIAEVQ